MPPLEFSDHFLHNLDRMVERSHQVGRQPALFGEVEKKRCADAVKIIGETIGIEIMFHSPWIIELPMAASRQADGRKPKLR